MGNSIAEIADILSEPPQRIRYVVSKLRIKHCRLVGNTRMYDESAQNLIKSSIYNIRIQR